MRQWMPIAALLAIATILGCAGMEGRIDEFLYAGSWWKSQQTNDIRQRAKELEDMGELSMALDHWRLIEHIANDRSEARGEVRRLENKIDKSVKSHYQYGIEKMKSGEPTLARNHFLAALRLAPLFQPARQQIKAGFSPFPLAIYHSKPGDRPATIAKSVFGDAKKAFLVSWFNDLPADAAIPADSLLILPKLEKPLSPQTLKKQPQTRLEKARKRLTSGDVKGALALTDPLNAADPAVVALKHAIYLKQAMMQTEEGRFDAARQSLSGIPDEFPGKAAAMENLQVLLDQRQITADLEAAALLLEDGDFQGSLDLTSAVLSRAPENTAACNLADEARFQLAKKMAGQRKWRKARSILKQTGDGHGPSMALMETVTKRLAELSQTHYRNGVKHFINEDLKAAVDEWEKALDCNPNHAKARENIANARRIMKKIETMP